MSRSTMVPTSLKVKQLVVCFSQRPFTGTWQRLGLGRSSMKASIWELATHHVDLPIKNPVLGAT